MSNMNLPLEIYDILERKLGRDDAMPVAKAIEVSLSHIEKHSYEFANQRKLEAKEELKVELRNELSTKEDLAKMDGSLRQEIAKMDGSLRQEIAKMDKKFTVLWLITIFTVIFVNQNTLEFLARILGLVK
ncbi:MAG: hypothetical protein COW45_00080 [Gallionellales bacterium CG17_big_fil_post_rev_8_21_14_2_50_54_146]|nr:MAG: hypothetical protein COW45_00080 [Gallionellales bacterium CG17_big_fil_post_rev_8_21_14_2_50_54_146]